MKIQFQTKDSITGQDCYFQTGNEKDFIRQEVRRELSKTNSIAAFESETLVATDCGGDVEISLKGQTVMVITKL